jgi:hypothetical protein
MFMIRPMLIGLLLCFAWRSQAQNRYVYIADARKYVLSESVSVRTVGNQPLRFHSLFVWQKDKVVRILFHYGRKLGKAEFKRSKLTPFESIVPAVKEYRLYSRSRRGGYATGNLLDGVAFSGKPENEILANYQEDVYKQRVLVSVNNWNEKYNRGADRMVKIITSDGDPYTVTTNKRQRAANNLPIAFHLPGSDSAYVVRPYRIDVYKLDAVLPTPEPVKAMTRYALYASISLDDDYLEASSKEEERRGADLKPAIDAFITLHTLPRLYDLPLPATKEPLLGYLGRFPLSKWEDAPGSTTPCNTVGENALLGDDPSSVYNAFRPAAGPFSGDDCVRQFPFCRACQDPAVAKAEKIEAHCPVTVVPAEGSARPLNWSFAFLLGTQSFFKEEVAVQQDECGEPQLWQFSAPGVGYWLSNVTRDSNRRYFLPDVSGTFFLINQVTLKKFFNP